MDTLTSPGENTVSAQSADALPLTDFDFDLPPEMIAQIPVEPRAAARLLCVDRHANTFPRTHVRALPDLLRSGDLLVVNDTEVIPARLYGKTGRDGAVELLFIRRAESSDDPAWLCL